ncbi:hypothetical protein FHS99_000564 [Sphingomonas prati]|uniref:Uncharacterized protein n=1 Tax=Sphingomonas prati TaxID=1843237 RepID=A0A7W9BR58_9SPHN|nr:hypothetical protein [Sphingomonas prati]
MIRTLSAAAALLLSATCVLAAVAPAPGTATTRTA